MLNPAQFLVALNAAAPGQSWGIGGTVTYPLTGPPLPTGWQLIVQRAVPYSQQTQVNNQTAYPASTQTALDILCFEIQQAVARTGQIRGTWVTNSFYNFGDIATDGANGANTGNLYACANANTSGIWATDLANGDWVLAFNIQAIVNALPSIANNQVFGNVSGSNGTPIGITLTALIDSAIGNTQGDILYRNATVWGVLPPGAAGQVLATEGAGSNPQWVNSTGSGTITSVTAGSGLTGGGGSGGVTVALATIANNSLLGNATGSTAAPGATTLSALIDSAISSTQGVILYRSAAGWVALAPGTAGYFLSTGGASANPSWAIIPPALMTPLAIGSTILGKNVSNSSQSPNTSFPAVDITPYVFNSSGTLASSGDSISGTWINLQTVLNNGYCDFQRIA